MTERSNADRALCETIRECETVVSELQAAQAWLKEIEAQLAELEADLAKANARAVEQPVEVDAMDVASDEMKHRCEDCHATMNYIGQGLYECWKCTEAEIREKWIQSEAENKQLCAALVEIRDGRKPQVCAEYEVCSHEGCAASYEAFAIADAALKQEAADCRAFRKSGTEGRLYCQY